MKKKRRLFPILVSILAGLIVISCNNSENTMPGPKRVYSQSEKITNSYGLTAGLKVEYIEDAIGKRHSLVVDLKNGSSQILGIPIDGRVRSNIDTSTLARSQYDCVIEVKQNGVTKRSSDIPPIGATTMWNDVPFMLVVKNGNAVQQKILYIGNLVKDFSLANSTFFVRAMIIPSKNNIKCIKDTYEPDFDNKYRNVIIVTDTIITPFVKIDNS